MTQGENADEADCSYSDKGEKMTISHRKRRYLAAAVALGRRTLERVPAPRARIGSPRELAALLMPRYGAHATERFGVVLVDARRKPDTVGDDTPRIIEGLVRARRKAILVLNKVDLVDDPELLDLVELEVRELLKSYQFPGDDLPVCRVSALGALNGEGEWEKTVDDLMDAVVFNDFYIGIAIFEAFHVFFIRFFIRFFQFSMH